MANLILLFKQYRITYMKIATDVVRSTKPDVQWYGIESASDTD